MQHIFFSVLSIVAFCAVSTFASSVSFGNMFRAWMAEHNIRYATIAEEGDAFDRWIDNHNYIQEVNSQNLTYSLGHNQFSAMDAHEYSIWVRGNAGFRGLYAKNDPFYLRSRGHSLKDAELPESVDWVKAGVVSPVKDQGQCGSCWSFSATGALESARAIKLGGDLLSLSEQQLVDCDAYGNGGKDHGCNGGLMDNAFAWIGKNNGLCSEDEYPYVSGTTLVAGKCQKTCTPADNTDIFSYVDVDANSDAAFMTALSLQPVSIAIEADQRDFQLYAGGVFTGACGTNLDHGVLAVGYGTTDDGLDYYQVKNSWSESWGDEGYILLGRSPKYNGGAGQCGILMEASYPVIQ